MKLPFRLCLPCLLILGQAMLTAEVRVAGVFSDHCVLQRDMPLPIWGWAEPGEKVGVKLADRQEETVADKEGRWRVELEAIPAGGPHTLRIEGSNVIEVEDVLVGEVWIGVGQSNMMMGLGSVSGGTEAFGRASDYPLLRMTHETGPHLIQEHPLEDVKIPVSWGAPKIGSSAVSFLFAEKLYEYFKKEVPIGILNFTEIRPAESWCDPEVVQNNAALKHLSGRGYPSDTGKLFNGVVNPVAPFAIRGVLYYQGEMNGGRGVEFRSIMPGVIASWRKAWKRDDLPFLFVQLPGFEEHLAGKDTRMDMDADSLAKLHQAGQAHGYVHVREAQLMTSQSVPHSGMAVTIDAGEAWDIHPHDKQPVADRLFLQARRIAYGEKDVVANGPVARDAEFKGREVVIYFDAGGAKAGLTHKGERLEGFELAGADRKFHFADARIEGDKVVLSSDQVLEPVMVHYAWAGFPKATLYNMEGLPASPFRWYRYESLPIAGHAEFHFKDSELANGDTPPAWQTKGEAEIKALPDGTSAMRFTFNGASIAQNTQTGGGYIWNSDPLLHPLTVRPGCVVGYSVELAAEPGKGVARAYLRLAHDSTATGIDIWGGAPTATTESEEFVLRNVAHQMKPTGFAGGTAGFLLANTDSSRPFFLRRLSPITIVRPTLVLSSEASLDLGAVERRKAVDSKPVVISNAQSRTLPQLLADDQEPVQVPTILYGLADVAQDGRGDLQHVLKPLEHVGAVLIGKDADHFAFVGSHLTEDQRGLKLIGGDDKPGLMGGESPEEETFSVRFLGADRPGEYRAELRIVTQAGNRGRLSRGMPGEPPVNLYYVDVPVTVDVR